MRWGPLWYRCVCGGGGGGGREENTPWGGGGQYRLGGSNHVSS